MSQTVVFNVIFSFICDLPVVEKRGLAMQQHVSDTETPQGSSNQVETHRLTMLMQAVF